MYFFLLNKENSSGWQSRLGVIAQDTIGDTDSLCFFFVPSPLTCDPHSHGQKTALETVHIERTLKTGSGERPMRHIS